MRDEAKNAPMEPTKLTNNEEAEFGDTPAGAGVGFMSAIPAGAGGVSTLLEGVSDLKSGTFSPIVEVALRTGTGIIGHGPTFRTASDLILKCIVHLYQEQETQEPQSMKDFVLAQKSSGWLNFTWRYKVLSVYVSEMEYHTGWITRKREPLMVPVDNFEV
ncbi:hypothetical protein NC651_004166 [Populus alba x Populus x berolinensis]|nr:hypothetical protein NC651_004166 [Populus alba x Populus x berolinensis]